MRRFGLCLLLAVGVGLWGPPGALAVEQVWDGSEDGNWADGDNWDSGSVPGDDDWIEFYTTPGTNLSVNLGADRTMGDVLTFNSSATNPVTLEAGNKLTIQDSSGNVDVTVEAGSANHLIACDVELDPGDDKAYWYVASGSTLTVSGAISGGSNLGTTLTRSTPAHSFSARTTRSAATPTPLRST